MDLTFSVLLFGAFITLCYFLMRNLKYWQNVGVPCASGALPFVGNMWQVLFMKSNFSDCCRRIYQDNKKHSMVGCYNFMSPMLIVIEPELVKTVLQTNFSSFHKNGFEIDEHNDPLLTQTPFFSYGEKWAVGRKRFTHAFSNMRLKILFETVKKVCDEFDQFLNRKLSNAEKLELELKDLFSKYTAQVAASAGFGVDGFCFNDDRKHKSFQDIGRFIFQSSFIRGVLSSLVFFVPIVNKILRIRVLPKEVDHFFRTMIADLMEKRRTDGIPRNDFLQLMVELEPMESDKINLDVLASHAVSFFMESYDTSSSVLSYVGFQLAVHPEIQEKLREEVRSVLSKYDNVLTFDALKEMTYMEQVISESQRVIPVLGVLTKLCTEDFELKGSDGLVYRVKPGMQIVIPVHALHEDSRHWDNPEIFDPDRFSRDRKQNINKFTYLPFGEGPRVCVGMRMALLQLKACLATLMMKYRIELSPKTRLPLKMSISDFLLAPEGGFWGFLRSI